mmetsp:Transcript_4743/g.8465  ORF Transcript_4743/g.8465 Transcript_4743/m.8465 type:complete len:124 (-) Transcript_4743:1693-2064(-)
MQLARAEAIPPDIIAAFSVPEQAAAMSRVGAGINVGKGVAALYDGELEVVGCDEVDGIDEGFVVCVGDDETVGEAVSWGNVIRKTLYVGVADGLDDGFKKTSSVGVADGLDDGFIDAGGAVVG